MIAQETTTTQRWYGCYDGGWQNLIQPEAYAHPAKFSRNLIARIYTYALERGWLKPGDTVLDCFGGVGLGALDAGANGLNWVGVELETRFTDLGQGCDCTGITKADWVRFYGRLEKANYKDGRHWCPECLAQAKQVTDSRQLSFFEPEPTATYTRNSGVIPETFPHRYRGNLDLFKKYAKPGTWAVLLNGDSRQLRRVVGQAVMDAVLSSPPYSGLKTQTGKVDESAWSDGRARPIGASQRESLGYGLTEGQLGGMSEGDLDALLSSPPFSPPGNNPTGQGQGVRSDYRNGKRKADSPSTVYGATSGQLGSMPMVDLDALLSSPPFAGNTGGRGEASRHGIDAALFDRHSGGMKRGTGENPANLDHLPMRGLGDAVVTSPPWEGSLNDGLSEADRQKYKELTRCGKGVGTDYGQTTGQLGTMTGGFSQALEMAGLSEAEQDKALKDAQEERRLWREQPTTFWEAARAIVTESYMALKPGSYAFFVTKNFVRDGKIIYFSAQWRQLCEACGFEFVEHIEAMLIQSESEQGDLNGGTVKHKKKKASFFRRLHEKKFPHLAIDCEDILVMRKP